MRADHGATCLATVTDAAFLPGTITLLSSFLEHNLWFTGDIVIIHEQLDAASRRRLEQFPHVRFHEVSRELRARLDVVTANRPALEKKIPVLLSLEAFNLSGYVRVLKLDSDLVCLRNAAGLFEHDDGLLCAPDQAHFWGFRRDAKTYAPRGAVQPEVDLFPMTFNCGLLLLSPPRLGADVYAALVDMVTPDLWSSVQTRHSDSVVLNTFFRGRWTPLSEKYNYLISPGMTRYTRTRLPVEDAVFLHFLGRPKPWQANGGLTPINDEHAFALEAWAAAARRAALRL